YRACRRLNRCGQIYKLCSGIDVGRRDVTCSFKLRKCQCQPSQGNLTTWCIHTQLHHVGENTLTSLSSWFSPMLRCLCDMFCYIWRKCRKCRCSSTNVGAHFILLIEQFL